MYGDPWPTKGEIDIMENWNDLTFNRNTAHVDAPSAVGACTIVASEMSAVPESLNCYDLAAGQYNYQGCSADQPGGPFGSATGGVYALEWTSDFLKIWSWTQAATPSDVKKGTPKPTTWGTPQFLIQHCDVDKAFRDLKLVFNIDFVSKSLSYLLFLQSASRADQLPIEGNLFRNRPQTSQTLIR
jgi:hypothetical protein